MLWGFGDLLQAPAGLLQLCQGVGRGQRGHGRVLDEGVAGVVAAGMAAASAHDAASSPGRRPTGEGFGRGLGRVRLLQTWSAEETDTVILILITLKCQSHS